MSHRVPARNPLTRTQKYMIGGAAALAAVIGGVAYAAREPAPTPKKKTTEPKPSGRLPSPTPTEPTAEGAAPTCDLGPEYPGYVVENGRCVPSAATPAGIYLHSDCTDFDFVPGDDSTQAMELQARIDAAVTATADYTDPRRRFGAGRRVNPVTIATEFLQQQWPQCPWPPGPDASSRVIQMFMMLSFAIGRQIYNAGGNVLGYDDPVRIDEEIVDALAAVGLTAPLDPSIVPELQLPEITREPPQGAGAPGAPPHEPQPPKGGIVPPGGVFPGPSGGQPGEVGAEQKPDCLILPFKKSEELKLADMKWSQHGEWNMWLFDVSDVNCETFRVRFGLCLREMTIFPSYGLLSKLAENYPTRTLDDVQGSLKFQISDGGSQAIPLEPFRHPYLWKQQYEAVLRRDPGNVGAAQVVSLEEIEDPSLDGCFGRDQHYPLPQSGFTVNEGINNWDPRPQIELVPHPQHVRTMLLRIRYQGLPVFDNIDGDNVYANNTDKNGYTAYLKVDAIGLT